MIGVLKVLAAGPGVTVQDAGRRGLLRWGVTLAGSMDRGAFEIANRALARPPGQSAIEVSIGGLEVEVEGGALGVAVVGGGFRATLDRAALPCPCRVTLAPGQRLKIAPGRAGCWSILAVNGRLDLAAVLGSTATHQRSGIGGLAGRGLRAGDRLEIVDAEALDAPPGALALAPDPLAGAPFRAILGPQAEMFSPAELERFFSTAWTLSPRSDRMAYRLEIDAFPPAQRDIVSDATARGAVQISGDGAPLVLMADRQPTGGYPKIATVIGADLDRLAQTRPGAMVRFRMVSVDEAVAALRERTARLAAPIGIGGAVGLPSTEALLGENLISGVETNL